MQRISSSTVRSRSLARPLGALLGASALVALVAGVQPAAAQVVAPADCGIYSGQPIPPGYVVLDLRVFPGCGMVGSSSSVRFNVPSGNQYFVIGTQCVDYIQGNDLNEIFCGLGAPDEIRGGGGNDQIYGGKGRDILEGEEGLDEVGGNDGNDLLYGEDASGIIATDEFDELSGGQGTDFGDLGPNGFGSCTGIEDPASNC